MSEVIDFHTRLPVAHNNIEQSSVQGNVHHFSNLINCKLVSWKNDRLRRNLSIKNLNASCAIKRSVSMFDALVLDSIFEQLKYSQYEEINFGTISEKLISDNIRNDFENSHAAGLIHNNDDPVLSVVWMIDQTKKRVNILTAEEYFCGHIL